ncbi:MAG TPA: FAD-linked oxidase C-terminal domain-containing protein [Gaiellaceae bacterium]|nr:FAD-linked oxidase C-terminal domain-containing protein [Gaiellaceae bacterium]
MTTLERDLAGLLPEGAVSAPEEHHVADLMGRGLHGHADAICFPATTDEVARVVAWCYEHDVPMTPRGGATGLAGGAIPDGGVIVALERLNRVRSFEPLLWRMHVEAGVTTGTIHRLARENGLRFPPDPGAAELSQIGGNIATNAGGPHAFKHGVTGRWITGIEAVVPPGEAISVGGAIRKDVAGYDLRALLTGSEGTLGIVTAAWLRLMPAPEAELPLVAFLRDTASGCAALEAVLGSGVYPAAVEYLDGRTLEFSAAAFPQPVPDGAGFMVLVEVDGSRAEAEWALGELEEALAGEALGLWTPSSAGEIEALWRWRAGVAFSIVAQKGGAISEDIAVPLDRLQEAVEETLAIGAAHGVEALSFGHAGDGNLHSTFLFSPDDPDENRRARAACDDLFALAIRLEGTVTGEHGIGLLKVGQLERQWGAVATDLHRRIKQAFDPKGLLNPGKKL